MTNRPQFRLCSLFILTAIVAVGCWAALSWGRIVIVGLLGLPYLVAGFAYLGVRLFRKLAAWPTKIGDDRPTHRKAITSQRQAFGPKRQPG